MKNKFSIPSLFKPVYTTAFIATSAFVLSGSLLNAAGIWDGGGADALWSTVANWDDNALPASGSDVTIQAPFTSGQTINTNGNQAVGKLTFGNGSAATSTLSGETGNILTVTSGVTFNNSTGTSQLSVPTVDVGSNPTLWGGAGSSTFNVNSAITGTVSALITKSGSYKLRLKGDNSGFSGGFTITRGQINGQASAALINSVFGSGPLTFASTNNSWAPSFTMNYSGTVTWANAIVNNCSSTARPIFRYDGDAFTNAIVNLTGPATVGANIVNNAKMEFDTNTGYSADTYGEGRWTLSGDWSGYMAPKVAGDDPQIIMIAGTLQFDTQQAIAPTPVLYSTGFLPNKSYAGNANVESGILGATTKIILNGPFTMANTVTFQSGEGLYGTGLSGLTSKSLGSSNDAATTATISGTVAQYTSAAVNLFCLNAGATLNFTGSVSGGNASNNLFINDVYSYATGGPLDGTHSSLVNKAPAGTVIFSGTCSTASNARLVGGTLLVNGSMTGGSPLTVAPGATLGGTGSIVGATSLDAAAGLAFTINSDSASHNALDFGDTLALTGVSTVTITSGAGAEAATYTLATSVNGITGLLPTLIKPGDMAATLAFSGDGKNLLLTITDVGGSPYDAWAASYNLTGPEAAADYDADFDGVDNLTEYALGTSPIVSSGQPPMTINGSGDAEFSFTRPNDRTDITSIGQYSTTLTSWSSDPNLVTTSVHDNGNGTETITVTEAATAPASDKVFLRLFVEKP